MKAFYILTFLIFSCTIAYSQPVPPAPIPIDGRVGLLLAAGVGYGLKKMRRKK